MQKLPPFWKSHSFYLMSTVLILGLVLVFKPLLSKKFYGFEYEDSFISSHVSSQENIAPFVKRFRTKGCETRINGECVASSSYTGHYISYSVYLFLIKSIFNIDTLHLIHKVGNALLFGICFLLFFLIYKESLASMTLMFSFIACLPAVYVLNSGLIENLSFCLGFSLMISIHQYLLKNIKCWLYITFVLLILLVIVKRENLIYLTVFILINPKQMIKDIWFWVFIISFLFTQYIINPFFTEGIEASQIGRSTFSIDYFVFQFPTYLNSFFRLDGFLALSVFILLYKKPTKRTLLMIFLWLTFIILYSFHYRGQYAIETESISHFESFRYMFNTIPFLMGCMLFGRENNKIFKNVVLFSMLILSSILIFKNVDLLKEFGAEEFTEYHSVNQKIDLLPKGHEKIAIHDNFVLISMLNTTNQNIDIFSAEINNLKFFRGQKNILINRFDIIDIENFNKDYEFEKNNELSSNGIKVYYFEECL